MTRLTGGFWRLRGGGADWRVQVLREALLHCSFTYPSERQRRRTGSSQPHARPVGFIRRQRRDQVVPGQALAAQAMKMENLLRATQAARVTQILVSPGDSLSLGDVIMEFEPLDEAESQAE